MPMNQPYDLTDLETLKEYMSVTTTTDDSLLTRMISAASKFLLSDMNRSKGMQSQPFDTRFDGTDQDFWQPRDYPLLSVTSVVVGTITIPQSTDYVIGGWILDAELDRVVLIGGYTFCKGRMNCRVQGTFGYAEIPEDVVQACCELVNLKYKRKKAINLVSEALPQGGGTAMFTQKDVTDEIRNVIEQYTVRF